VNHGPPHCPFSQATERGPYCRGEPIYRRRHRAQALTAERGVFVLGLFVVEYEVEGFASSTTPPVASVSGADPEDPAAP
jgi:hypothetical protein